MKKSRLTLGAAVTSIAALALAACGGSTASSDNGSTGGEGGSDNGEERILIEAIGDDPTGLNPQFAGGPIPLRFGFAILGTLVETNDQYEVMPGLAKEWEFSDDNRTLTFYLEEGVEWHDGEPFTSEDVKFNLEEIVPHQYFGAALAASIDSIDTPDDHTVVVHLGSQYGPFLEALSQQAMVPKHLYEGTDYLTNPHNMAPVGTGPMMFDSYEPGSQVTLVKNPNWWRGEVAVDRAIYPIMSDINTRTLSMLNGELDVAVIEPSQQTEVEGNPDLQLMERGVFPQMVALTMNGLQPELEDPEVRALVFSAIDREAVVRLALNDLGRPADGFIHDAVDWARHPDISFDEAFPRDLEAIAAGLDEAGYPVQSNGSRFTIDIAYISVHSEAEAVAEVIRSSLADVDIDVNLVASAEPVWIESVYSDADFGMFVLRNTVGADPSVGPAVWLACNPDRVPMNNGSGVCDEELQEAHEAALSTLDREERAEHFFKLQERALDQIYWAPLAWYYGSQYTVNTSRWSGLDDVSGQTNNIPWASLEWAGN